MFSVLNQYSLDCTKSAQSLFSACGGHVPSSPTRYSMHCVVLTSAHNLPSNMERIYCLVTSMPRALPHQYYVHYDCFGRQCTTSSRSIISALILISDDHAPNLSNQYSVQLLRPCFKQKPKHLLINIERIKFICVDNAPTPPNQCFVHWCCPGWQCPNIFPINHFKKCIGFRIC
jgi:hypothetical protein